MTSVEWLIEIYLTTGIDRNVHFHQAKEMEKQQIMEFVYSAVRNILNEDRQNPFNLEQYYNETYGSKGSDKEKSNSQRFDEFMDLVKSSQTEILDEEIEKEAIKYASNNGMMAYVSAEKKEAFIYSIKWYKEQLKTK
jgi:hypothetical protein